MTAFELLDRLIATPSISRDEAATADIIAGEIASTGLEVHRPGNNVWAVCAAYDPAKPTLLLNSHHDTVRPSASYTLDPFTPIHRDGRIYGLGSNDAGASVVSLIEAFKALHSQSLAVNLAIAITAEEEVSGSGGIEAVLADMAAHDIRPDWAIVGEPTLLQPAVAERGLLVLDCTAHGVSGHAARNEGDNAIYHAIDDIRRLQSMTFDRRSDVLGDIKISVTQVQAGTQHNVVPDRCSFVVDVRTTDAYTNAETAEIIASRLEADVAPRSTRLNASAIAADHPLVVAAVRLGGRPYVSPTMSDRSLMKGIAALKIGPGDSARSHTADEFVYEDEILRAIDLYKQLILSL